MVDFAMQAPEADKPITVTRFNTGDAVPEWLLAVEPMNAQAIMDTPKFMLPCDVIDLPDCYVIRPVPTCQSPSVLSFEGNFCTIAAAGKPVETIIVKSRVEGLDFKTGHQGNMLVRTMPNVQVQIEQLQQENAHLRAATAAYGAAANLVPAAKEVRPVVILSGREATLVALLCSMAVLLLVLAAIYHH